jgi:hypothetical protein
LVNALSASVIIIVSAAPGVAVVAPDVPLVPVVLLCAIALVPSASVSMEAAMSLYIIFMNPVRGSWLEIARSGTTKTDPSGRCSDFFQETRRRGCLPRRRRADRSTFFPAVPTGTSSAPRRSAGKRRKEPMRQSRELTSIIVVAVIAVLVLIAFLWIDGGFGTAPEVPPESESPATNAPEGVEPPEPNTPAAQ